MMFFDALVPARVAFLDGRATEGSANSGVPGPSLTERARNQAGDGLASKWQPTLLSAVAADSSNDSDTARAGHDRGGMQFASDLAAAIPIRRPADRGGHHASNQALGELAPPGADTCRTLSLGSSRRARPWLPAPGPCIYGGRSQIGWLRQPTSLRICRAVNKRQPQPHTRMNCTSFWTFATELER